MPERQTLLIVVAGTDMGMPPCTAAWRAVICPAPAWMTWPKYTSSTRSGASPARSRAAAMATPPSRTAGRAAKAPPKRPRGVRAMEQTTEPMEPPVGVGPRLPAAAGAGAARGRGWAGRPR